MNHDPRHPQFPLPAALVRSSGARISPSSGAAEAGAPRAGAAPLPTLRWRVEGGLDLRTVKGIQRHALVELPLHRRFALVLDLSQVDAFDAAGLQLLLSLQRTLGTPVTIEHLAPIVSALLPWETSGAVRTFENQGSFVIAGSEQGSRSSRTQAGDWLIGLDSWHLSLRFDEDAFRHGFDPLAAVCSLRALGALISASVVDDRVPTLALLDPVACRLGFELDLRTDLDADRVRSAIDALGKHAWVRAIAPAASIDEYVALIYALPEGAVRATRLLLASGVITPQELEHGLRTRVPAQAATAYRELARP